MLQQLNYQIHVNGSSTINYIIKCHKAPVCSRVVPRIRVKGVKTIFSPEPLLQALPYHTIPYHTTGRKQIKTLHQFKQNPSYEDYWDPSHEAELYRLFSQGTLLASPYHPSSSRCTQRATCRGLNDSVLPTSLLERGRREPNLAINFLSCKYTQMSSRGLSPWQRSPTYRADFLRRVLRRK